MVPETYLAITEALQKILESACQLLRKTKGGVGGGGGGLTWILIATGFIIV